MERQVAWYPGHMAKAARRIREYLRSIDIVVEIVDARIARSGRNPLLDELAGRRPRVIVLNRQDLAEPATTKRWLQQFRGLRFERRCGGWTLAAQRSPRRGRDRAVVRSHRRLFARDDRRGAQLG